MKKKLVLWDKLLNLKKCWRPQASSPVEKIAPFFDFDFYQSQSGQKFPSEHGALEHFLEVGWKTNCSPCASFCVEHYLSAYPDIREAKINPLLHFLDSGWQENRLAFSVFGQINELIGYRNNQLISLGPRPLEMHIEWTSCNRLAGWIKNALHDQSEVQIYHHSKLIGFSRLHQYDFKRDDVKYRHFEMFLEGPLSPITAKYTEGKNEASAILAASYKQSDDFLSVNSFLQRHIEPSSTTIAPCSKNLVKAFIANKRILLRQAKEAQDNGTLVSIVMPVFNRESLVAHAIKSIKHQRHKKWELIIVDDGSTDNSLAIISDTIKELDIESRTRVIASETNHGVSHARNQGLAVARGSIIAYLDSDNTWDQDYLSLVVAEFESDPGANSVYAGQYVYLYNEILDRRYLIGIRLQPFDRELLEQESYIDLNIFAHRRELYEQLGGFNEQMRRLVDWDLILKYTQEQHPRMIQALLAQYNLGIAPNQITYDLEYANSSLSLSK